MNIFLLDTRRLLCPMPVIKVQNKIQTLQPGDILTVICTDPGVLYDIPSWCRINGHTVLDSDTLDKEIIIRIKVGYPDAQ